MKYEGKILWIGAGGNSLAKAEIKGDYLYVHFGHSTGFGWQPWTFKRRYKIVKGDPRSVARAIFMGDRRYTVKRNYAVIGTKEVLLHDREHKWHYEMWEIIRTEPRKSSSKKRRRKKR